MANERDFIWQQQGASSFVKVKMDWAQFGRIHFSFVQHSGKPECKQVANIEAALKVDGGDGALYLAQAVLNRAMAQMRAKALEEQKVSGAKYPALLFTSMGGTLAKRSKTGKCMFRQISLMPGMKTDYVLQAIEAEGEETLTGGIAMKKGAQVTRITVGMKREELISMASALQMAWQAYLTISGVYGIRTAVQGGAEHPEDEPQAYAGQQSVSEPAAWVVYDSLGETFEIAVTPEAALLCVQESITQLRRTERGYARRDNTEYHAVKAALQNGCDELPGVTLFGKDGTTCDVIIVKRQIHR